MDPKELITLNPDEDERKAMEARMNERKTSRKKIKKEVEIKTEDGVPAPKKIKKEKVECEKKEAGPSSASVGPSKLLLPEKAQGSYSIANDPNASEALKSLFTSHETAKKKPKAHWITHNPLFY